jgi:pimeloyl-ACP methyl ester carboxylesterase
LAAWKAEVLASLPHYYVMPLHATMPEAVAPFMPTAAAFQGCSWLPDEDLAVYVSEYARRGFQGGLQWYRCSTDRDQFIKLSQFSAQRITVPSAFVGGASDWGIYQSPGAFERMQVTCTDMRFCTTLARAGHWVQQEQAQAVNALLLQFLSDTM